MPDTKKYKTILSSITGDNERVFLKMLDSIPAAVYVTSEEGKLVYVNPAAITFSGRKPDIGNDRWCVFRKLFHPDGKPILPEESPMAVALKEGRSINGKEMIAERPDGTRIFFEAHPSPLYNEEGEIVGGINMLADITRQKREEQLHDVQREILDQITSGIPLEDILVALCKSIPRLGQGLRASVLLVKFEGEYQKFKHPVAPDLLPSFSEKLDGISINEEYICTCSTAIQTGEPVTCADITNDEQWNKEWRGLCMASDVQACYSFPVRDAKNNPVASFMLCLDEPGEPDEWMHRIAEFGSHMVSTALDRSQPEPAVPVSRTKSERTEAGRIRLAEQYHRFEQLVTSTKVPSGVVQARVNGQMTVVNDRLCEMLGYSREEMLGMNFFNITHPDSFRKTLKSVNDLEGGAPDFIIENQYCRADGSRLPAVSDISALRNEEDEYKGFVAVVSDIAGHEQAESNSSDMKLLLEAALFAGEVVAFVWDIQNDLIKGNEALANLFSVEPEEISEGVPLKSLMEAIHEADRKRVQNLIDEAIETGEPYAADYRIYSSDGQLLWVAARGHVEYDGDGTPVRFPGVLVDVTRRKETEAKLAQVTARSEREKRLCETIFSSTPDLIYVFDLNYRFTYVNDALLQMWERSREELVGKSPEEVGYEPWHTEMLKSEIDRASETQQTVRREVTLHHAKTEKRIYDYIFVPVLDDKGDVEAVAGAARDITELKEQKKQIEAMNSKLEEQLRSLAFELSKAEERERQRLAAELHDNLGQLLAVGKMKLGQLRQDSLSGEAESWVLELAALIDEAIRYTRELMSELKPPPSIDKGDLTAGIKWVLDTMDRHGLNVSFEDDGKPKLLSEDVQATLRQCTKELLFNVIKHAGVNEARVALSRKDGQVRIVVEDRGKGFDVTKKELIPDDDGGFGLFSIRERMDLIGGSLEIESEPGAGTKMVLRVSMEST